jgi:hypothetical protein
VIVSSINIRKFIRVFAAVSIFSCILGPAGPAQGQAPPQDVVTVATVTATGLTVDVPVSIRDTSGTPLGIDQPAGSRIQSYSIKVDYSPASAVSSVTFTRAGITTTLTPTFESSPASAGSISLLDTFQESTNLIPFTSNAAAPGNQVAHLTFNLSPTVTPGSTILLSLDATLTQLTDQAGTGATKETVAAANLALANGAIIVPTTFNVPTLAGWMLIALVAALAFVAVRLMM